MKNEFSKSSQNLCKVKQIATFDIVLKYSEIKSKSAQSEENGTKNV